MNVGLLVLKSALKYLAAHPETLDKLVAEGIVAGLKALKDYNAVQAEK